MDTLTKVFIEEFKGHPIFAVWEVNGDGQKQGKAPIISFGKAKASVILEHLNLLQAFGEKVSSTKASTAKSKLIG
jgi:hypothetical protein